MSGEYDDLFTARTKPGVTWFETLPPEPREWIEGLVHVIKERGEHPAVWSDVNAAFGEKFPAYLPRSKTTIPDNVRRLLDE